MLHAIDAGRRVFFVIWPANLADVLGDIAYVFGFAPSEMDSWDYAELMTWYEQSRRIDKELSRANRNR